MANIILIVPPLYPNELYARGATHTASKLPPLGLAYLGAYLMREGHKVTIHDGIACPCSFAEITRMCEGYDLIGISAVSTYAVRVLELTRHIKQTLPSIPIVVGGPHVTALPESLITFGADYAVIGEGEQTLLELANALDSQDSGALNKIDGLCYVSDGQLIRTNRRRMIDNLDDIPMPARELLPMHLYSTSSARSRKSPSHSLLASRGCPGVCTFCSKKTFGSIVRYFSPSRIVDEFFELKNKYGAKDIAVWDDNFTANNSLVSEVCDRLLARGLDIPWSVESRVDTVTSDVLKSLRRAGCECIAYGIESGSQRVLDSANKKIQKETIKEVIEKSREAGLFIRGYFMMGLPGESEADMLETVKFALSLNVDMATFTLFVPLPGTAAYRQALKSGTFKDPEYFYHRILPEFNLPDEAIYTPQGISESQLLKIHKSAYSSYYFRPSMFIRHLKRINSVSDIKPLLKGLFTLISNRFHPSSKQQ